VQVRPQLQLQPLHLQVSCIITPCTALQPGGRTDSLSCSIAVSSLCVCLSQPVSRVPWHHMLVVLVLMGTNNNCTGMLASCRPSRAPPGAHLLAVGVVLCVCGCSAAQQQAMPPALWARRSCATLFVLCHHPSITYNQTPTSGRGAFIR